MFIKQRFDEFLGFEYKRDNNTLEVRIEIKDLYINSAGVIHGGIISTLADVAMGNLIPTVSQGIQELVTVDLKISYLKPAKGEYLLAQARLMKNGRKLVFAECQIYNDNKDLVAVAHGIFSRLNSTSTI
ncbi:MAG TPA: PaaI family thioesterase [Candidatus Deferrimicrobium sp.]|nr:PaaI family thioesterase [Candidatus Deferrimicrobium sp.]